MPSLKKIITVPLSARGVSRRNRDLGFILKMSSMLASPRTLDDVLLEGLKKVMRYFHMERGRVYVYDPEKNLLILHTSRGIDVQGLESMTLEEGFTGKAAISRCFLAQRVEDMKNKERAEKLASLGFKSLVCLPLVAGDRLLGVVNLGSKKKIELDPETVDLMVVAGNILALAALNAKYAQELAQQARGVLRE